MKDKKSVRQIVNSLFLLKMWRLLRAFHRQLFVVFGVTLLFEAVRPGGPFLLGKIFDLIYSTQGRVSLRTGVMIIGLLVTIRVVSLSIDYVLDILIARLLWRAEKHISTESFSKMLELSMDYHEKENTGTKIGLVNKGTDKLIDLLGSFTWEFQPIVLQLILSIVWMMFVSFQIGALFSLSVIPFLYITFRMFAQTRDLRVARFDAYETSSGEIGDTISNITVVQSFAQEKREKSSFQGLWQHIHELSSREFRHHLLVGFERSLLVELFYVILLGLGIWQIRSGTLSVGGLVFLINMIERAYSNVYRLGRIYNRAADAAEPVERISNLLSQKASIQDNSDAIELADVEGRIDFRGVSFTYAGGKRARKVLDNVSFTIPAGSFTAIVGKSGSGKSTIAKLISRYYDPTSGSIYLDGRYDLRSVTLESYRSQTAVVFQDSPVPSRKIWQVIAYAGGQKEFAQVKSQVLQAAKLAHAHEFIVQFEEGYETEVGERGVKLSGGQRQRLAIARALFAHPRILIMDEPTSHLDTLSEHLIQSALEEISRKRSFTKIVIAHRLSTVQHADQILVMEKGRLVEAGTHSQLVTQNGVYAQIVRQSELIKG